MPRDFFTASERSAAESKDLKMPRHRRASASEPTAAHLEVLPSLRSVRMTADFQDAGDAMADSTSSTIAAARSN
jgi:hypothetical protein